MKKIKLKTLAGFIALLLACAAAAVSSANSRQAYQTLQHSMQLRRAIGHVFGELRDAEAGQRGYLLTGSIEYLEPYLQAREHLKRAQADVRNLVANDPAQRVLLDQLDAVIARKMGELARTIAAYDSEGPAAALAIVKANSGLHYMQHIRSLVLTLEGNEDQVVLANARQARQREIELVGTIFLATLLAIILCITVLREEAKQREELEFKNMALREQMVQQQATEAQLRHAQKMEIVGQLTGGIAHDFNNMLAVIVGNMEMALRKMEKRAEGADRFIRNALTGAGKAADLTKRLLAFSRRQALRPEVIDVNACVQDMVAILDRTLGKGIAVELVLGKQLWAAYVDQPQLENAILNLAVNSRDAMNGKGALKLLTENVYLDQAFAQKNPGVRPGKYVAISVSDTGHGMTKEVMQRLFEPFYTTKSQGKGTGLGLAQTHGFLAQSNGHIAVESEVGRGTTVKLYLPYAERSVARPEPLRTAPVNTRRTVLVVEDQEDVRNVATAAVEELGYSVLQAEDAKTAEQVLATHPEVSILLSDIVMPGISGVQLADKARNLYPRLRILLMSGYARDIVEGSDPQQQNYRLLKKPFTIQELGQALQTLLTDRETVGLATDASNDHSMDWPNEGARAAADGLTLP